MTANELGIISLVLFVLFGPILHHLLTRTFDEETLEDDEKKEAEKEAEKEKQEHIAFLSKHFQTSLVNDSFWEHPPSFIEIDTSTKQGRRFVDLYMEDVCLWMGTEENGNMSSRVYNRDHALFEVIRPHLADLNESFAALIRKEDWFDRLQTVHDGPASAFETLRQRRQHLLNRLELLRFETRWMEKEERNLVMHAYPQDMERLHQAYLSTFNKKKAIEHVAEALTSIDAALDVLSARIEERKELRLIHEKRVILSRANY